MNKHDEKAREIAEARLCCREACQTIALQASISAALQAAAEEARAEERSECAKIAETFFDWCGPIGEHTNMQVAQSFAKECAKAIRERG